MAIKLTKRKEKWVNTFKPDILRGAPIRYNAAITSRYTIEINKLIREMISETEKEVKTLFKKPEATEYFAEDASISSQANILTNDLMRRFDRLFNLGAKPAAEKMVYETNKSATTTTRSSLKELSGGLSLKTDVMTGALKEILKATTNQNVSLIKTIPSQYLGKVQTAVMRSITTGNGMQSLVPFFKKQKDITLRHARNMALDQTRKAYGSITREKMKAVGVEEFEWVHSGGSANPRRDHIEMNGNIYRFDDPPIIDKKTGERGYPSDAINCKCIAKPVIKFD